MLTFVEHPTFTKQAQELFEEEEYRLFQLDLAARSDAGDVIPGMGGLRKISTDWQRLQEQKRHGWKKSSAKHTKR